MTKAKYFGVFFRELVIKFSIIALHINRKERGLERYLPILFVIFLFVIFFFTGQLEIVKDFYGVASIGVKACLCYFITVFLIAFVVTILEQIDKYIKLTEKADGLTQETERLKIDCMQKTESLNKACAQETERLKKDFAKMLEKRSLKNECVKKLIWYRLELTKNTGLYNLAQVIEECSDEMRKAGISEATIFDFANAPPNISDWVHFDTKIREVIVQNLKYLDEEDVKKIS